VRLLGLEPERPVEEGEVREPSNWFSVEKRKEGRARPLSEDELCAKVNLGP